MSKEVRCCLAGNAAVGKTKLALAYCSNTFTDEFIGVMDDATCSTMVDGEMLDLKIRDTRGGEDYERLTAVSFVGMDVFLMCFSLHDRGSFEDITTKWNDRTDKVKNIMHLPRPTPMSPLHYVPDGTPLILVA